MSNIKYKKSSNKSFGIVFFIVFLIIGFFPLLNQQELRYWSIIIAVIFLVLGVFNSNLLTPLNKIWIKFGILLGSFISPIIMGVIFFLVVFPTGIIIKLFKKNFIGLKYENNQKSYWIKKQKINSTMRNQF